MKTKTILCWLLCFTAGICLIAVPCYSQDPALEKVGSYGVIDWVAQKVIAKGTGAPPAKYYGKPQARPMAMRAATADARRNLLEVVKGVHIDSQTTVQKEMRNNDAIVMQVTGILTASTVDDIQYLSDGTIEATVSIPLTGQLGEALLSSPSGEPVPTPSAPNINQRLLLLEERVSALEARIADLKAISTEQRETISLLRQFVSIWLEHAAQSPLISRAEYGSEEALHQLKERLNGQENRLDRMATRIEALSERLVKLESTGPRRPAPAKTGGSPYTGLVIDARELGFKPCLKPKIYSRDTRFYPGDDIDFKTAVRTGYVRYYRKITRAQQSSRVGSLPYTVKAKGTYKGDRNLEIGAAGYEALKQVIETPDNFLQACKVVIVF